MLLREQGVIVLENEKQVLLFIRIFFFFKISNLIKSCIHFFFYFRTEEGAEEILNNIQFCEWIQPDVKREFFEFLLNLLEFRFYISLMINWTIQANEASYLTLC